MRKRLAADSAILAVCATTTAALLLDFCNLVFRCGCRSWWAGAAIHCNIHSPHLRHCPWCIMPSGWLVASAGAIVALQAWAILSVSRWSWPIRLTAGLVAFPAGGTLVAGVAGLVYGYWW